MGLRTKLWPAACAVVAVALAAAGPAAAATTSVTHRTVYATEGRTLYRLTLDGTGRVVARTPVASGTESTAADTAGGRTLFYRYHGAGETPEIWLRETSGVSRFLTTGDLATFTPGRTAVLVSRRVPDSEFPESRHSELVTYRLSDGRTAPLFSHGMRDVDLRLRYSADGRSIWMLVAVYGESTSTLMQYGIAERRILRSFPLRTDFGCADFELLPSGVRAVLPCDTNQLWTVRLADGAVTHRTSRLPGGSYYTRLHGRLNATTMLVSGYSSTPDDVVRHWLGALDLTTFAVRRLGGSTGIGYGITEY